MSVTNKEEIRTCGYDIDKTLGEGSYGLVYRGKNRTGDVYAFKVGKDNFVDLHEIDCLSRLNHPNILHMVELLTSTRCKIHHMVMVLPLAETNFFDYIKRPLIQTKTKIPIIYKICHAVYYLHLNGILHLDIKPENILMVDGEPKLSDFGYAEYFDPFGTPTKTQVRKITTFYRHPDYQWNNYNGMKYHPSDDVWALGVTIAEFLRGVIGFYENSTAETLPLEQRNDTKRNIQQVVATIDPAYRNGVNSLLNGMLDLEERRRFTMEEVLREKLFDGFRSNIDSLLNHNGINYRGFNTRHKSILEYMIGVFYLTNARQRLNSAKLLFLSISLYKYSDPYFPDFDESYLMYLAYTCIYMAYKLIYEDIKPIDLERYLQFFQGKPIQVEVVDRLEDMIITYLNGVLYDDKLYQLCDNKAQLRFSFDHIIRNDDVTIYAKVDLARWKAMMNEEVGVERDNKSKMKIDELFS